MVLMLTMARILSTVDNVDDDEDINVDLDYDEVVVNETLNLETSENGEGRSSLRPIEDCISVRATVNSISSNEVKKVGCTSSVISGVKAFTLAGLNIAVMVLVNVYYINLVNENSKFLSLLQIFLGVFKTAWSAGIMSLVSKVFKNPEWLWLLLLKTLVILINTISVPLVVTSMTGSNCFKSLFEQAQLAPLTLSIPGPCVSNPRVLLWRVGKAGRLYCRVFVIRERYQSWDI